MPTFADHSRAVALTGRPHDHFKRKEDDVPAVEDRDGQQVEDAEVDADERREQQYGGKALFGLLADHLAMRMGPPTLSSGTTRCASLTKLSQVKAIMSHVCLNPAPMASTGPRAGGLSRRMPECR